MSRCCYEPLKPSVIFWPLTHNDDQKNWFLFIICIISSSSDLENVGYDIGVGMEDFGPGELIAGFCQTDDQNPFPVWQNGHISPCFNQLLLGALPHACMAIFSACYLGMRRYVMCKC